MQNQQRVSVVDRLHATATRSAARRPERCSPGRLPAHGIRGRGGEWFRRRQAVPGGTRLARESSRASPARGRRSSASWESAKIASLVSRPGTNWRLSSTSSHRSTASRRTTVLARPYRGTRAPRRPRHQSAWPGGDGRDSSLVKGPPSPSLTSEVSRSRLATQRHISATSCGSGLGRPAFLDGLVPFAGKRNGAIRR